MMYVCERCAQSAIKGVHQILANEMIEAGVGADRTIIGGFSQGGVWPFFHKRVGILLNNVP